MKSARFGVAVFVVGMAVALGVFAYLLDHARATAHVVRGLGDAAEPGREEALEVPLASAEEGVDETESARRQALPVLPALPPSSGLEVHVTDEVGKSIFFADLLAYRGGELVRAGRTEGGGLARLIPFDGPGELAVEYHRHELARIAVADGHGRHEIVVPHGPKVAGIVRVDGAPREDVSLELVDGKDDWLAAWVGYGLERNGLRERPWARHAITNADGQFHFDWLTPQWSGGLRLGDPGNYRLSDGARRIELAGPDETLVLELKTIRPELVIRGRVVFAGEPVPHAEYEHRMRSASRPPARLPRGQLALDSIGSYGSGACDERGRFSLHAPADELEVLQLLFSRPGLGVRDLELHGAEIRPDLGDVELLATRDVPFVVRSVSGSPIAGARARPHREVEKRTWPVHMLRRAFLSSEPSDAAGHGVLRSLEPDEPVARFSARGYAVTDVSVPAELAAPLEVVLPRCAALQVAVRDATGRVPAGIRVRLAARGPPFTWKSGYAPEGDEHTQETVTARSWSRVDGYQGDFPLDERGQAWIDAVRPGASIDLSAVDEYGSLVAAARGLVLGEGEWRRVELRVESEPRTLLVVVRDTFGHPLSGAWLRVQPVGGPEPRSWTLRTDRAGMARTEPLYADAVTALVSREGFETRSVDVTVPREGATLAVRLAHDWWTW